MLFRLLHLAASITSLADPRLHEWDGKRGAAWTPSGTVVERTSIRAEAVS